MQHDFSATVPWRAVNRAAGARPATLPAYLSTWLVTASAQRAAVRSKQLGIWHETSWACVAQTAEALARGFRILGVGPEGRVIVAARPTLSVLATQFALHALGAVIVPVDPGVAPEQFTEVLRASAATFVVTDQMSIIKSIHDAVEPLEVFYLGSDRNLPPAAAGAIGWEWLRALGEEHHVSAPLAEAWRASQPASAAFEYFDRGAPTTLHRRIVSHRELILEAERIRDEQALTPADRALTTTSTGTSGSALFDYALWVVTGYCLHVPETEATRDIDCREIAPTVLTGTAGEYHALHQRTLQRLPSAGTRQRRRVEQVLNGAPADKRFRAWLNPARFFTQRSLKDVLGLARVRCACVADGSLEETPTAEFFAALGIAATSGRPHPRADGAARESYPIEQETPGAGLAVGAPPTNPASLWPRQRRRGEGVSVV